MGQKHNKWRLIIDGPQNAFMNMAVDEAIFTRTREEHYRPTIRFSQWERPSISYGYAVKAEKELNIHYCQEQDIQIVRRITGGGVVFHQCDITFSIIFPEDIVPDTGSVLGSYKFINQIFILGLQNFGIRGGFYEMDQKTPTETGGENVCFLKPTQFDIIYEGKKLVGNAQRRKKGYILNHGSILFTNDYVRMLPCLNMPDPQKMLDNAVTLQSLAGKEATRERVIQAIMEAFTRKMGVIFAEEGLSEAERQHAEQYYREKYSSYRWNFRF